MPHINLVYPFMPDVDEGKVFQDAALKAQEALADIQPFKVCHDIGICHKVHPLSMTKIQLSQELVSPMLVDHY